MSVKTAVNGTIYAQPLVNFPCLMAVNKDLLDAAGVEKLPETWTELIQACLDITDPANNVYGFGMNMSTDNATCMEFFAAFLWNSGGTILTEDDKPYLADNELLIETTDFFKSLFENNVVIPSMFSLTDADKVQEFVNGRVAFMPDSVAHLSNIREQAPDMNITYVNMPHKYGVSKTTVAVAWILRHPADMQVVCGTTNLSRFTDCCKACDIELTYEDWYNIYLAAGYPIM